MKGCQSSSDSTFAQTLKAEGATLSPSASRSFFCIYQSECGRCSSADIESDNGNDPVDFFDTVTVSLIQNYNDGWLLLPIILALNARFVLLSATLAPYQADVDA
jgi:hypothetical protein